MAHLFSKQRVLEEAERLDFSNLAEHVEILEAWRHDYFSGTLRADKEENREQAFNSQIFGHILGYAEKPAPVYTFEAKPKTVTPGGETPDGVLCYTDPSEGINNTFAVIELKGSSADLDKPQRGYKGQLSPVQQAFKYKPQFDRCPFVIVSNLFEFRLYNDNQLDYESWTLTDLVNPANNYENFRLWYTLLCASNMTSVKEKSNTEELLKTVRIDQEKIGTEFYERYRAARLALLRDMRERNEIVAHDIDLGISKAQKIMDRVVFCCFAEDGGLLPENTLRERVKAPSEMGLIPVWDALKGFFKAVDQGSEKLNIPVGYNGGLFREDPVLDDLEIGDEALLTILDFDQYDFQEDLGVTILGHLFEQSITDLEEIRDVAATDSTLETLSRRKRDGIFYTPDYIVRFIIDQTLGEYVRGMESECRQEANLHDRLNAENYAKRERVAYLNYQVRLGALRIVDPACGSGAFLVHVFDFLMAEYARIEKITGDLFSTTEYVRKVLRENIFGVDVNDESVEITKLSLWLKSASKNEKLTTLNENILCGNSLIASPEVAGEKAFSWEDSFPEIFENGGFDVVVGNPPYVQSHIMVTSAPAERVHISQEYKTAKGNWDLYVPFIEKGLSILREGGRFGFIIPNKVLGQDYARELRKFIENDFSLEGIVDVSQDNVFEKVAVYPVILLVSALAATDRVVVARRLDPLQTTEASYSTVNWKNWTPLLSTENQMLTAAGAFGTISDYAQVYTSAAVDEAYKLREHVYENSKPLESELKLLTSGAIEPYFQQWGEVKTTYLKSKYDYPVVRKDVIKKKIWSELPKIVIAGLGVRIEAVVDQNIEFLPSIPSVVVTAASEDELHYLSGVLNSEAMSELFKLLHSSSGLSGGYMSYTRGKIGALPYVPFDSENPTMVTIAKKAQQLSTILPKQVRLNKEMRDFLVESYSLEPSREMNREILALSFEVVRERLKGHSVVTIKEISELFKNAQREYEAMRGPAKRAQDIIEASVKEIYTLS
ncbi:SAM-dependent DNA methyltransferase [Flaviflexus ciconiae]|uniref:site-specific DNA-methyltransferase (adenine-specific) n=1 Tax=Flaviflexus ciconiae TaxID=2496867 RepID=A0A3Q9G4F6_9ACTO|nr:N-6 DNA methylase [Flaviflexus ciconiae]AZQ77265.1 SAM-dependent DNA methyltransferase [Flaviflexus ciconiae]